MSTLNGKKTLKDSLVIGFAQFAIFFGAGNLIFPPMIGLASGEHIFAGLTGMTLAGILLPMMAVWAIGNMGTDIYDITKPVTSWWHNLYIIVSIPIVCLGTIPRCGGVAYEIGVLGIAPQLPAWSKWAFLLVFFGLSYYFANNKSKVVDRIGTYVTPFLLVTLLVVLLLALINPLGKPSGGFAENPFSYALLQSYNTGDVGTGLVCTGIVLAAIQSHGYTEEKERKKMLFNTIAVTFVILFVVYGGLCILGSTGSAFFEEGVDNTSLLVGLVTRVAGYGGIVVLAIAIIFACFTTAAGMIAVASDWIDNWVKGRVPYKLIALILTLVMFFAASLGVNNVITISGPLFIFLYPMAISLTILGCLTKWIPNNGVWKGTVFVATAFGLYDGFAAARANGLLSLATPGLDRLMSSIPLASIGLAWVIPAVIGGIAGGVIYKAVKKEKADTV